MANKLAKHHTELVVLLAATDMAQRPTQQQKTLPPDEILAIS